MRSIQKEHRFYIWGCADVINPTFCDVLTVYHQIESNKWVRSVYKECYFGVNNVETISGATLSQASSYIARIPYYGERNKLQITSGDIVVLGEISDTISDEKGKRPNDLIAKYKPNCFTVRTFKDNTKILNKFANGIMQRNDYSKNGCHYKLTGA